MESLSREFIFKFLRFGIVGASGVFVDFGITYICKEILRINKYISNSIGFLTATISNYILNRIWTFHSVEPTIALQFSKFLLISIIGLGINNTIILFMTTKFKTNFYISKALATLIVMFWNFFANYYYTF
jgi:putative flippase GtrA